MRREGWEERLIETVNARLAEPFAWGSADCFAFVAAAAAAMTGDEPYAGLRSYTSRTGAARWLAERNMRNVQDAMAALWPQIPVAVAGRGDAGVVLEQNEPAAVLFLDGGLVGKGEAGVIRLPRTAAIAAYRVT